TATGRTMCCGCRARRKPLPKRRAGGVSPLRGLTPPARPKFMRFCNFRLGAGGSPAAGGVPGPLAAVLFISPASSVASPLLGLLQMRQSIEDGNHGGIVTAAAHGATEVAEIGDAGQEDRLEVLDQVPATLFRMGQLLP